MRMMTSQGVAERVLIALALCAGCACGSRQAPAPQSAAAGPGAPPMYLSDPRTLAIAGADNGEATVAAEGARVVVTWAAATSGATDIYAAVSEDAGSTFGTPVRVNDAPGDANVTGEQPPRAALHGNTLVVIWPSHLGGSSHIRLARSSDGGRTFAPASTLNPEPLPGARGWASVAFGPDGLVHALWLDGRRAGTSSMPHDHASDGADHGAMPMPMHSAAKQALISATWSPGTAARETTVADDVCFCCKTALAVGPDGSLYAAYRNIYPNSVRDIAVARWAPGSTTPMASQRVSQDEWHLEGCPDDGPALWVDSSNRLHVVWPTSVDAASGRKGLFYAFSDDAGKTFSPRIRIDDEHSDNAAHPQITGSPAGLVVAWDQLQSGETPRRVVFMRRITNEASPGSTAWTPKLHAINALDLGAPAIYPSLATASDQTVFAWTRRETGSTSIQVSRLRQ